MSTLAITRPGIVAPARIDPTGRSGPTKRQAAGRRWRPAGPRHYVPSSVDSSRVQQRIVEAVGSCPPGSAATGWAGISWLAPRWFDGCAPDGSPLEVPVALGDNGTARPRPGVLLSEDWLFDDDVMLVDGLPITVPERSVTFAARTAVTDLAAIQTIDMAAYHDLVDLAGLSAYAVRLGSRPGACRLRRAIAGADENAWSPQESLMRRLWVDHRGSEVLTNAPLFDDRGNHLLTLDVFDPAAGVGGEYDGDGHASREQRRTDIGRQEIARTLGIEVATMMAGRGERSAFLGRLERAYGRARGRTGRRSWTLEPPAWWVDTTTVAGRRALTAEQADRWLAHRRRT